MVAVGEIENIMLSQFQSRVHSHLQKRKYVTVTVLHMTATKSILYQHLCTSTFSGSEYFLLYYRLEIKFITLCSQQVKIITQMVY
jgi:hypothetical protein